MRWVPLPTIGCWGPKGWGQEAESRGLGREGGRRGWDATVMEWLRILFTTYSTFTCSEGTIDRPACRDGKARTGPTFATDAKEAPSCAGGAYYQSRHKVGGIRLESCLE